MDKRSTSRRVPKVHRACDDAHDKHVGPERRLYVYSPTWMRYTYSPAPMCVCVRVYIYPVAPPLSRNYTYASYILRAFRLIQSHVVSPLVVVRRFTAFCFLRYDLPSNSYWFSWLIRINRVIHARRGQRENRGIRRGIV